MLIATGADNLAPSIKGIDKEGVYTLRNLEDVWNITKYITNSHSVLVIGGGIQGLETAHIISQMGKRVILAEILPRLMPKQLDQKASQILEKSVRALGVEVILDTKITEILGNTKVNGAKTWQDTSIPCDTIIYSIGISPDLTFLKDSQILTHRGVIVNEKMETNIPDIYAAGDCAEYHHAIYGLWPIAIEQGRVAGLNSIGHRKSYKAVIPVTTLSAFQLSLFSMGMIEEGEAEYIVLEEESQGSMYSKVYIKNSKVVGAIVIGNMRYSPILKTAIEQELYLKGVNFNQVSFNELLEIIKKNKQIGAK